LPLGGGTDSTRRKVNQVRDELVGVLGFDAESGKIAVRKVLQVEGVLISNLKNGATFVPPFY